MNLLECGRRLQFRGRIAENFFVGQTVENPLTVHVDDGDDRMSAAFFTDQVKQLLPFFDQPAADPVNEEVLIDGVRGRRGKSAQRGSRMASGKNIRRIEVSIWVRSRKKKGSQRYREKKRDNARCGPKPPFPPFNTAEIHTEGAWVCASRTGLSFGCRFCNDHQPRPHGLTHGFQECVASASNSCSLNPQVASARHQPSGSLLFPCLNRNVSH